MAADITLEQAREMACREHLGVWTELKRGLDNAPLHWEWTELRMSAQRMCVVAPREHAKTETFTVNGTAWESRYNPGLWTYVFAQTGNQAADWLDRIVEAVWQAHPWMMEGAWERNKYEVVFANHARVTVAGSGKSVRGAHPDRIIGDDVLSESNTLTKLKRKRIADWWFGTVSGMSHPGTTRGIGRGANHVVTMGPTRVFLVGTPFHQNDLLMSMRENPLWQFRRYQAEFDPRDCVDGLAVEVA